MTFLDLMNLAAGETFFRNGWNVDGLINSIQLMIVLIGSNPFFS